MELSITLARPTDWTLLCHCCWQSIWMSVSCRSGGQFCVRTMAYYRLHILAGLTC